jgi:hypothetical protein
MQLIERSRKRYQVNIKEITWEEDETGSES